MELFVLLDLLGGERSNFLNFFPDDTGHIYNILSNIGKIFNSKIQTVYFEVLVRNNLIRK
jgi:hypothetical protein